jgi:hypothetical protein
VSKIVASSSTADTPDAPGLDWRKRASGERIPYWIATRKAVEVGYPTKTVRLDPTWSFDQIAAACRRCQIEMQAWLAHGGQPLPVSAGNTWRGLIAEYECNPISRINIPFEEGGLKFNTRNQYLQWNIQIDRLIGMHSLTETRVEDFKKWYEAFAAPKPEGGTPMRSKAKSCMEQINRLLQFGVAVEIEGCERLARILNGVGNNGHKPVKFKGGNARTDELTLEHVKAFVAECHKPDRKGMHDGLALATVIQFETTLRQADVIGQWWPEPGAVPGSLTGNGTRWRGLTWGEHIDADLIMEKPTSKSREVKKTLADLAMSDLVMAELALVPLERRVGPVVISGYTGLPYQRKAFNRAWRQIANAAGIPKSVQNRDARSGAITEALTKGANPEHLRSQTTHAETPAGRRVMNNNYDRPNLEKVRSVQRARNEGRKAS